MDDFLGLDKLSRTIELCEELYIKDCGTRLVLPVGNLSDEKFNEYWERAQKILEADND